MDNGLKNKINSICNNSRGFTLIELMVGVAIIGILVGIAYPSYLDFVTRSNRSEGLRELARIASLQEQFYVDNRTYTTDFTALGVARASAASYTTEHGWYVLKSTIANSGASFTITATPQGKQASNDTSCQSLSINQTGKKLASDGSNDTSSTCWEN